VTIKYEEKLVRMLLKSDNILNFQITPVSFFYEIDCFEAFEYPEITLTLFIAPISAKISRYLGHSVHHAALADSFSPELTLLFLPCMYIMALWLCAHYQRSAVKCCDR